MKLKALFKAFNVRTEPFISGYRPDWCSPRKLEYNCAQLIFTDKQHINPGEEHQCILQPFIPEFWAGKVAINDVLRCMEGPRQVGEAIVQEIIIGDDERLSSSSLLAREVDKDVIASLLNTCCNIARKDGHNFCPSCGKEWEPSSCKFCHSNKSNHDVSSDGKIRCRLPWLSTFYTPRQEEPQKRVVGQCCYHCGRVVGDHAVAMNKLWCKPPFDTSYKPLSKENK